MAVALNLPSALGAKVKSTVVVWPEAMVVAAALAVKASFDGAATLMPSSLAPVFFIVTCFVAVVPVSMMSNVSSTGFTAAS